MNTFFEGEEVIMSAYRSKQTSTDSVNAFK